MKKKRLKKFLIFTVTNSLMFSILILICIFIPAINVTVKTYYNALSSTFVGKKAEYQGVISLWNIDTFEGGSSSKSGFLMARAQEFEKQNKGAFIKVENLTVDEMISKLKNNEMPHIVSFGSGVGNYFEKQMLDLNQKFSSILKSNLYGAGLKDTKLLAVAWAVSGYSLISTSEKIEKVGFQYSNNLKELIFKLSYDKKVGKKSKHINSLTFGGNNYSNALNSFVNEFVQSPLSLSQDLILDDSYNVQTYYDAYCNFIENKASILYGTGRDLYRMNNRLSAGKLQDFVYEPLEKYTDLVQFISVLQSKSDIEKVCRRFVSFLLNKNSQEKLVGIGMCSARKNMQIYKNNMLEKLENSINENTKIKSAFI